MQNANFKMQNNNHKFKIIAVFEKDFKFELHFEI